MRRNSTITITDMFCGAGGSSQGATSVTGVELIMALNHWPVAIATHNENFPHSGHDCSDISATNPRRYPSTIGLIASPECTNHSMSNGKKKPGRQLELFQNGTPDPAAERSRATMWDVPRFAEVHQYQFCIIENVVEARNWPLWDAWIHSMDLLGYEHECVYLNSMHAHPTPQSRDRMYVVFWKKGNRKPNLNITPAAHCPKCAKTIQAVQSWKPGRSAGRYRKQYLYCCPVCATVVEPYYYAAANAIDWSLPTQKIGDRSKPLKEATLRRIKIGLEKFGRVTHYVVQPPPFILNMQNNSSPTQMHEAMATLLASANHKWLVEPPPFITNLQSNNAPTSLDEPLPTVLTGHHKYLTSPADWDAILDECGFRMLEPNECKTAMAFPAAYKVTGNKREQIKQWGNAVTPPAMELLAERVVATLR